MGQGLLVGAAVWIASAVLMFVAGQVLGGGAGLALAISPLFVVSMMLTVNIATPLLGGTLSISGAGLVFLLIPIFGMAVGGYVVASGTRSSGTSAGIAAAIGFFVLQVLGVVLLFLSLGGGGAVTLGGLGQLAIYLLIGGLVQPAVFGTLGGAFAGN